ncbi:MAG TPA: CotH kinase family protein, partial [Bacteroidia bacterium]
MKFSKKILYFLFMFAFGQLPAQTLSEPILSMPGGYYTDSVFVAISSPDAGVVLRYTLNGDEPGANSPVYSAPLLIKSRVSQPNTFSAIPTNPGFNYPLPGYDSSRADSRGWLPPLSEIYKITILKVKAFKVGFLPGKTVVASYIVDPITYNRFSLPVLSLSTDSANLFSDSTGIYVYGINSVSQGNYSVDGTEHNVHVQLYDENGNLKISQYCGMRNHGGGGRHAPQKSLRLVARSSYGLDSFGYQLFRDKNTDEFKSFLLRNGGHRPDCFPRDDLAGKLVQVLDFEVQHSSHVIVFINGEYWGIQAIKDIFDEYYIQEKYDIKKEDVAILELSGFVDSGNPGDESHYINMRNYAVNNNLTLTGNYNYLKTQMDIENYIDYNAAEIYFGNGDWPNNNIKFWRYKTSYNPNAGIGRDGRWRWMMYDLDAGFGGDCSGIYYTFNALNTATSTSGGNSTRLLRALLTNPEFKNQFINRSADLMNTVFKPQRFASVAGNLNAEISPEMTDHVNRWRYPSVASTLSARNLEVPSLIKWNDINADLLTFGNRRPGKVRGHYMNYFSLTDTINVTVNVTDTAAGRIKISTLIIDNTTIGANNIPYPWTGKYFTNIALPLKAMARPGYRFLKWQNTSITNPDTLVYPFSDTTFTAVFVPDPSFRPYHYLYINELSAQNSNGAADEYNERNDWFEIYNPNNYPVDIDNYYITDSLGNKKKFRFSSGSHKTVIPAKGFLLVWADEQNEQGVLHANFKLSSQGEQLALTLPDGITVVDSVVFGGMPANHSWGRENDGADAWIDFGSPTPGRSNKQVEIIDETAAL